MTGLIDTRVNAQRTKANHDHSEEDKDETTAVQEEFIRAQYL